MSLVQLLRLLCIFICGVYACQVIEYSKALLKMKISPWAAYTLALSGVLGIGLFGFYDLVMPLTYATYILFLWVFYKVSFYASLWQIAFAANNFVFHLMLLRSIVLMLFSLILGIGTAEILKNQLTYFLSLSVAYLAASLFFLWFRHCYVDSRVKLLLANKAQLRLLVMAQTVINGFLFMASAVFYLPVESVWFSAYHLFGCLLVLAVFYIIFDYCANVSYSVSMEIRARVLEEQLEKQLRHYQFMTEYINSFRKVKHDYSSLLSGALRLLELGDVEKAKAFLHDMQEQVIEAVGSFHNYSNHPFVQALLADAAATCKSKGIDFTAEVGVPTSFAVKDIDICRAFSNLLSNAIEACDSMTTPSKYIIVNGGQKDTWFSLTVENSYDGKLYTTGERIVTRKDDGMAHGVGLDNISEIVARYGGMFHLEPNPAAGRFTARVHLPCASKTVTM